MPVTVTTSKTKMRAGQTPRLGVDIAVVEIDFGAHRLQTLDVLVDGRSPIAQPPGSDTRASPQRASSGPSARIDARIVFTIS